MLESTLTMDTPTPSSWLIISQREMDFTVWEKFLDQTTNSTSFIMDYQGSGNGGASFTQENLRQIR
jgi:hypothetical protein